VPSVAVHADVFSRLVDSVVRVNGMPRARRAYVPTPVMGKAPAELRAYIEGDDPVHGRPFAAELVDALTRPVDRADLRGVELDRSAPRLVDPDTEGNLRRLFEENHWTDYLPIVLPTEERVEAMLAGTSRDRDEIVGSLRPTHYREAWQFTVEKVAVNAVMAGARPEYLPVILALASSGFSARISSTSSMAAMAVVNGPIREEIGMNSGLGALGPYNHANATIGRSYGLLSQNLQGGSVLGETYMGCQGSSYAYNSLTFAENEEASPWRPYHVRRGFSKDDSTTTSFQVWGNVWTEGLRETWQEKVIAMLAAMEPFLGTTLLLDPLAAQQFVNRGLETVEELVAWVHEHARIPAGLYWEQYTSKNFVREDADLGIEPFATYAKAAPEEMLPVFQQEKIQVVVVGGSSNAQWSAFMGGPLDARFRNDPADPPTVSVDVWR
jgi:hypothetical protein